MLKRNVFISIVKQISAFEQRFHIFNRCKDPSSNEMVKLCVQKGVNMTLLISLQKSTLKSSLIDIQELNLSLKTGSNLI